MQHLRNQLSNCGETGPNSAGEPGESDGLREAESGLRESESPPPAISANRDSPSSPQAKMTDASCANWPTVTALIGGRPRTLYLTGRRGHHATAQSSPHASTPGGITAEQGEFIGLIHSGNVHPDDRRKFAEFMAKFDPVGNPL